MIVKINKIGTHYYELIIGKDSIGCTNKQALVRYAKKSGADTIEYEDKTKGKFKLEHGFQGRFL